MRCTKYHIRRERNLVAEEPVVVKCKNVDIELKDRDSYRVIVLLS